MNSLCVNIFLNLMVKKFKRSSKSKFIESLCDNEFFSFYVYYDNCFDQITLLNSIEFKLERTRADGTGQTGTGRLCRERRAVFFVLSAVSLYATIVQDVSIFSVSYLTPFRVVKFFFFFPSFWISALLMFYFE